MFYPSNRNLYGLVLALFLLAAVLSLPQAGFLRPVVSSAIYPFQFAAYSLINVVSGGFSSLVELRNAAVENSRLKQELEEANARLSVLAELERENVRLKSALDFKYANPYGKMTAAKIIGKNPNSWFSTLVINRGRSSGIRENLAVVTKDGVVGRIVEVYSFSSKVLLLTDPESSIPAVNQRSRDLAVAQGAFPGKVILKYVDVQAQVEPGDLLVTSSLSDYYPAGIPIGEVVSAVKKETDLFYEVELKPLVNLSQLEEVFVLTQ